jgi:K+-transporting ATPase A subunit
MSEEIKDFNLKLIQFILFVFLILSNLISILLISFGVLKFCEEDFSQNEGMNTLSKLKFKLYLIERK